MPFSAPFQVNRGAVAVLALATLIVMAGGYDLQNVNFVAPALMGTWNEPAAAFGPVFAAGLAGSIPGAMLAGALARQFGLRASLCAALVLFGLATLLIGFVGNVADLLVARFAVGIGLGAAIPMVLAIIAATASASVRSTFVVIALCGQPLGAMLGAQFCAWATPLFGWQSAFVLGGTAPLLLAPLCLLLPRVVELARDTTRGSGVGALLNRDHVSVTLLLWSAIFIIVPASHLITHWLPIIFNSQGRTLGEAMNAMSLLNGGALLGAVLTGAAMDRIGPFRVLAPALLVSALALFALSLVFPQQPVSYALILIVGVFAGGAGVGMGALAIASYPPALHTTGAGWVYAVGRIGAALGPLAVGAILFAGLAPHRLVDAASAAALIAAAPLWLLSVLRRGR